ncbi:MAG TPA: hypothetical protein DDW52_09290 [Planctomycetaceae bacterium]|nr:hypothetical protein [Planctomycetaceae bacterium]
MQYLLRCQCGTDLHVTTSQAGDTVHCKACNSEVDVPRLRELKALPTVASEESTTLLDQPNAWRTWRGPTIALCAGALLVFGAYATWFSLQYLAVDRTHDTDFEIAYGNEAFDQYSPEELSLVWNNYEEVGIGQKQMPEYEKWQRYAEARKYLAIINGSIAGGFLLASLAIWISVRSANKKARKVE